MTAFYHFQDLPVGAFFTMSNRWQPGSVPGLVIYEKVDRVTAQVARQTEGLDDYWNFCTPFGVRDRQRVEPLDPSQVPPGRPYPQAFGGGA